ncbi:MAG: RelA/SpoT domain-containing protein [Akkermansiaceae bacterium]|nr:RelA/SpoT domain-containing protein [Akkermansiaceae bacterium]
MVEVRAKGLPSLADKILRKRDTYQTAADPQAPDPLIRLTDLCGGRIICQTSAHVNAVCGIIEKAFVIDWANSEDVSQRLKPAEFGYRSVHYIVQVDPALLTAAGLDPRRVKVLCHAPGDIARAECVIAITLGARVGVLLDPALSRARQFDAAAWVPCGNLLQLPLDPMTVRAFLQIDPLPLPTGDLVRLEPAARQAHEAYTASARPTDDSMQPWEKLPPTSSSPTTIRWLTGRKPWPDMGWASAR